MFTKSPWPLLPRASKRDLSEYPPHVLCDTLRSHSHIIRKQQLLPRYVRDCPYESTETNNLSGPVGFKPTYSASFLTSIGPHNALLIRTVVAHSINPSFLTEYQVKNWFTSLGLDFPTLKIIAISFGPPTEKPVPSIPPAFHIPLLSVAVLGSHWPQATISGPGFTPAGGASPMGRIELEKEEVVETEYDVAANKTKGWMEKRKRNEVENIMSLRNTDLRAGDDWLVYVSPAVKKRMARRMW